MRNFELYPSTLAPRGEFLVIKYEMFSGVGEVIYCCLFETDAIYRTDIENFARRNSIDPYCIAYNSIGNIIRDQSAFPKRPQIAL